LELNRPDGIVDAIPAVFLSIAILAEVAGTGLSVIVAGVVGLNLAGSD